MNPAIKKNWVSALRSGEYEQGTHGLNINGRFCCYGVLCDLAVKAGVDVVVGVYVAEDQDDRVSYDNMTGYIPNKVQEWAGLGMKMPKIDQDSPTLAELNDSGSTFLEIAELIESTPDTWTG